MLSTTIRKEFSHWLAVTRSGSLLEKIFGAVTILLAFGMAQGGPTFAKWGIPLALPASMGSIPHLQVKLFVFEIYLLFVAVLAAWGWWQNRPPVASLFSLRSAWLWCALLFLFGMARAMMDLRAGPLLVVRNSSFVWYLALPLMIPFLGLRPVFFDTLLKILTALIFLLFFFALAIPFIDTDASVFWFSEAGGCYMAWVLAFLHRDRRIAWPLVGIFAFAMALSFFQYASRTHLMVLAILAPSLLLWKHWHHASFAWRTIGGRLAAMIALFFLFFHVALPLFSLPGGNNLRDALARGTEGKFGVESYRLEMWKDAWRLFQTSPLTGIGFEKKVVERIYIGIGKYIPNDVGPELGTPPISGPHNSYLNAMTRMGILGIGFFLLPLWGGLLLLRRSHLTAFCMLLSQAVYAAFNVGLEGPSRSAVLLLALGFCFTLAMQRKQAQ